MCSSALDSCEPITEYTIAVDVLGKTEDFKEGKDAIVRVEVHRLRKRLARFYEEEGSTDRVRIVIPAGNYTAQFQLREHSTVSRTPAALATVMEPIPKKVVRVNYPSWSRLPSYVRVAVVALLLASVGLSAYQILRKDEQPLDGFWNPVLSSSSQILLCIGNQAGGHTHPVPDGTALITLKDYHNAQSQTVNVADAATLARFASFIESRGKRYRVVSQSEATYAELQRNPAVLIGLNNDWSKRLLGNLRYTVDRLGGGRMQIRDHMNPSRTDWFIDYYAPMLDVHKDYALIVRATDPKTEQMTVMAAGMSVFGTLAAGEFLTNASEIRKLSTTSPNDWPKKNLEIILSTEVIRGNPGPPTIVATYCW